MYSLKKQQGMTAMGIVFMLIGLGVIVMLALKILPVYMEHGKVKSALESVGNLTDIETKSKSEVKSSLKKRFLTNGVESVPKGAIKITKFGNYIHVQIQYDVEVLLTSNLYALIKFDDEIEAGVQ